jgi:hypothetical protein
MTIFMMNLINLVLAYAILMVLISCVLVYVNDVDDTLYPALFISIFAVLSKKSLVGFAFFAANAWPDHRLAGALNVISN